MDLAFVLELLEFPRSRPCEFGKQVLAVYLVETGVQTEGAFFESTHFLEAQSHIVHCHLHQESVFRVLLKLKPVQ